MGKKQIDTEGIDLEHPFVRWAAALWARKALIRKGKDYLLDAFGGKRFGIGVDPDGTPVLAVLSEDREAFMSIAWSSAALVKNYNGSDWVALACKDIRLEDSVAEFPVPIRLWIPMPFGLIDGFMQYAKAKQGKLRVRVMKKIKGRPTCARSVLKELPLVYTERK